MKKGFTMIELIFVIVILGILASVAIPRLASTRQDAEISAAIANLRTLVSDLSTYYAVNDRFSESLDGPFKEMTNVKVEYDAAGMGSLKIGNDSMCIQLRFEEREDSGSPARLIVFGNDATTDAICRAVLAAPEIQEYSKHNIYGICGAANNKNDADCVEGKKLLGTGVLIGASTSVY